MTANNIVTTILAGAAAPDAVAIPAVVAAGGRRIAYRGYLIHGEIPGICYVIYGRNAAGRLAELGSVADFPAAMRWIDRHLAQLPGIRPVGRPPMTAAAPVPVSVSDDDDALAPAAALRQAA